MFRDRVKIWVSFKDTRFLLFPPSPSLPSLLHSSKTPKPNFLQFFCFSFQFVFFPMGCFILKPITFVFAYFFCLNEKQMWGWFALKPITFVFAYFFCLNEKQMWGWFVLKPITFVFAKLLIFLFLIIKMKIKIQNNVIGLIKNQPHYFL